MNILGMLVLSVMVGVLQQPLALNSNGVCSPKDRNEQHVFAPSVTSLSGKLISRREYGPPGFGENPKVDTRFTILVLTLDRPIDVVPPPENKEAVNQKEICNVSEIHIYPKTAQLQKKALRLVGKKVSVHGQLNEGMAPADVTPVTMEVENISPQ